MFRSYSSARAALAGARHAARPAVVLCFALAWAQSARAVPIPAHSYSLDGTLADSQGGPTLTPLGGTLGASGYSFAAGQGLRLSGGVDVEDYSIEMRFSIADTSFYRKLIDFVDLTSDNGLYNLDTQLRFYPLTTGPSGAIPAGVVRHLVFTRDSSTSLVTGYIDGISQFSFVDGTKQATFSGPQHVAHFFVDDTVTSGIESTAGFVDFIRVYDAAVSAADARALFAATVPEPSGAPLALVAAAALAAWARGRANGARAAGG